MSHAPTDDDVRFLAAAAEQAGIDLWTEDGQLRYSAAADRLGPFRARLTEARPRLVQWLRDNGRTSRAAARRLPRRRAGAPLSHGQEALWALHMLAPESTAYGSGFSVWVDGRLDASALARAIEEIGRRHAILRTTVRPGAGGPEAALDDRPLALVVTRATTEEEAVAQARALEGPFDLEQGPVSRALLCKTGGARDLLALSVHHIAFDGASTAVFLEELEALYTAFRDGRPSPLADLPAEYLDFADWQRTRLSGEALAERIAVWARQLEGAPAALELPTDRARPIAQTFAGVAVRVRLEPEVVARVDALARAHGASRFMVLLAAWATILGRFARQSDVVVGSPFSGRVHPDTERLIGYFVQTLPLRLRWDASTAFSELVEQAKACTALALAAQEVPLSGVVGALRTPRDASRNPIYQTLFTLDDRPLGSFGALGVEPLRSESDDVGALVDVALDLADDGKGGIEGRVELCRALFDAGTGAQLASAYAVFLDAATRTPRAPMSSLPIVSAEDQARLAAFEVPSAGAPRARHLATLLAAAALRSPDAVAVVDGDRSISYAELHRRANQVAHWLRRIGLRAEGVVAVELPRSIEAVVAMVGTWRAGGVTLPLDGKLPDARRAFMESDARVQAVVGAAGAARAGVEVLALDASFSALDGLPDGNPEVRDDAKDAAVVLYTSGTTGTPKGVLLEHRSLSVYAQAFAERCALGPSDRTLAFASLGFDASLEELLPTLSVGGTLVVREEDLDPVTFMAHAAREGITVLDLPTAYWRELVISGAPWPSTCRLVIIGGERAEPELVERHLADASAPRLLNSYGPTETTICATWAEGDSLRGRDGAIIGRPVPGARVCILDEGLARVPVSAAGELFVGGGALARGYVGHPELTAERFLADPFVSGGRLYRTGDRGRWLPDGQIEFLGRVDEQVKIRGFRIEPAEVESALAATPGVRDATVLVVSRAGQPSLHGYVVLEPGADTAAVRASLRGRLPEYMVPSALVPLERIPLTMNGKVDRSALPATDDAADAPEHVEPRTPTEEVLANLFAEVLGIPRVGALGHFFALGGSSLAAVRLVARLRQELGVTLSAATLLESSTPADLGRKIDSGFHDPPMLERVHDATIVRPAYTQRTMLSAVDADPGTNAWNMPIMVDVQGVEDFDVLVRSVVGLVDRYDGLRTWFERKDGDWALRVCPVEEVVCQTDDLRHVADAERLQWLKARLQPLAEAPYDQEGALMHLWFGRTGDTSAKVVFFMHHALCDAEGVRVLIRDIPAAYVAAAEGRQLPPPRWRYIDFAAWQAKMLEAPAVQERIRRRRAHFASCAPLELPYDAPPGLPRAKKLVPAPVPREALDALRALGARRSATVPQVMQALWTAVLHGMTRSAEIPVTLLHRGPRTLVPEVEEMVGLLGNHVMLRVPVPLDGTFGDLLDTVRRESFEAFAAADLPPQLVLDTDVPFAHPYFTALLNYIPGSAVVGRDEGGVHAAEELSPTYVGPKTKLVWILTEADATGGLFTAIIADLRYFTAETTVQMAAYVRSVVDFVASHPNARLADLPRFR